MVVVLSSSSPAAVPESRVTILVVGWFPKNAFESHLRGIARHLDSQGLREGRDFTFDYRQVRSQNELDGVLMSRGAGPVVIYSINTTPGEFVRRNGTSEPHVFLTYSDPLADGWITSYARPGGNATGVVEYAAVHEKRLDLLTRLAPRASAIAMIVESSSDGLERLREDSARFARTHPGISIALVSVARGETVDAVASRLRKAGAQAAYVPLHGGIDDIVDTVFGALRRERLPAIGERRGDIERGAVLSLAVDRNELRERISHQLALVLRGTPPGEIPVHSPRKFLLTVNMDAARRIGVEVPRSLLRQADFIVSDGR
jgi:putative ABC transport system substrate-binding protein